MKIPRSVYTQLLVAMHGLGRLCGRLDESLENGDAIDQLNPDSGGKAQVVRHIDSKRRETRKLLLLPLRSQTK